MASIFEITARDIKARARVGILKTPHGEIQTPVFVPVGTQGTVKSLTSDDLTTIGVQIFFANTYHLYLRPGANIIQKLGGIHKFIGWNKPLMTDSGGFQVFSLARKKAQNSTIRHAEFTRPERGRRVSASCRILKPAGSEARPPCREAGLRRQVQDDAKSRENDDPALVKIDNDGVTFRSHLDGSLHRFTPEISIGIQQKLGADIILAFDECPPYGVEKTVAAKATERTHDWALRSLRAFGKPARVAPGLKQALFGIIQGGVFKNLREESAKFISDLPFDGVAIGGVAVGESKQEMRDVLDWVTPYLPEEKPRHLLGVGEIDDIFESIERGIDMLDCVMPTRLGRMGQILTKVKSERPKIKNERNDLKFRIDITKAIFADDQRPIAEDCKCYVCQYFSRAYLNHLFRARELLAYRLATFHNLYFMNDLMRQIREAIIEGRFGDLKREWLGI